MRHPPPLPGGGQGLPSKGEPPPLPGMPGTDAGPGSAPEPPSGGEGRGLAWLPGWLEALGLQRQTSLAIGANYAGEWRGREWTVHCSAQTATRYRGGARRRSFQGWRLRIQARTPAATRLALVRPRTALERAIARVGPMLGAQRCGAPPALEALGYEAWAKDPEWARAFLDRADLAPSFETLLDLDPDPPVLGLGWSPGTLAYSSTLETSALTPDSLARWLEEVERLALALEADPPPTVVEPTALERFSKQRPYLAAGLFVGGVFAVVVGAGLAVTAVLIAVAVLLSRFPG